PHFTSKYAIERMIAQAGIPATILRPNCFMQNDAVYFKDALLGPGLYPFPIGEKGVSMVDVRDIAEVAAGAVLRREQAPQALPNEIIHLVGPDALTGPGIAGIWARLMNKPVTYTGSDTRSFEARLAQHAPAWMAMDMRLMLDRFCSDGMSATTADVDRMTQLLGHSPRSYAEFAAETLSQWQV
ncbi:MAG: NmrA family NAD(P)-binding protein, partial [Candidatus Sericytochromatia bacterium]|nr:NmrA family NAD(P)-binding protein [Candidatus Sericytochromatia bacterium]